MCALTIAERRKKLNKQKREGKMIAILAITAAFVTFLCGMVLSPTGGDLAKLVVTIVMFTGLGTMALIFMISDHTDLALLDLEEKLTQQKTP